MALSALANIFYQNIDLFLQHVGAVKLKFKNLNIIIVYLF